MNGTSSYRPEIDGLRAIAVLVVVFYHADLHILGWAPFQGGYLGVDVFFVISGYLISRILLKNLERGTFSFLDFYGRRARRILPALMTVIVTAVPLAWFILLPGDFEKFAQSVLSVLAFGANIFFWNGQDYFADATELNPLLHCWSLSLEEQFYFLFPVLLFLGWRLLRRHLTTAIALALAGSFALSVWTEAHSPSAAFYLLPARGWELLIGVLLARLEQRFGRSIESLSYRGVFTGAGLLFILSSVVLYDEQTSHPSFPTLAPVLGTAMVIWFGKEGDRIARLLVSKAAVGIGLISYSLYLWHHLLFAFARNYSLTALTRLDYGVLIVLSLALSYFQWKYIETPFRSSRLVSWRIFGPGLAGGTAALVLGSMVAMHQDGFPQRADSRLARAAQVGQEFDLYSREGEVCGLLDPDHACHFTAQAPQAEWLLVGDSHAEVLSPTLVPVLLEQNFDVTTLTSRGCPLVYGFKRESDIGCLETNARRHDILAGESGRIVLVAGRLQHHYRGARFDNGEGGVEAGKGPVYLAPADLEVSEEERKRLLQQAMAEPIRELLANGNRVVLIYPVPEVGWDVPKKLARFLHVRGRPLTTSHELFREQALPIYEAYDSIPDHPNLVRVYPEKIFCDTFSPGRCATHTDREVFYSDSHHLSKAGVRLLVKEMLHVVQARWSDPGDSCNLSLASCEEGLSSTSWPKLTISDKIASAATGADS